jgi:hypothetical protein
MSTPDLQLNPDAAALPPISQVCPRALNFSQAGASQPQVNEDEQENGDEDGEMKDDDSSPGVVQRVKRIPTESLTEKQLMRRANAKNGCQRRTKTCSISYPDTMDFAKVMDTLAHVNDRKNECSSRFTKITFFSQNNELWIVYTVKHAIPATTWDRIRSLTTGTEIKLNPSTEKSFRLVKPYEGVVSLFEHITPKMLEDNELPRDEIPLVSINLFLMCLYQYH